MKRMFIKDAIDYAINDDYATNARHSGVIITNEKVFMEFINTLNSMKTFYDYKWQCGELVKNNEYAKNRYNLLKSETCLYFTKNYLMICPSPCFTGEIIDLLLPFEDVDFLNIHQATDGILLQIHEEEKKFKDSSLCESETQYAMAIKSNSKEKHNIDVSFDDIFKCVNSILADRYSELVSK